MTDLPALLDQAEALVTERLAALGVTVKGESAGHPFRGNQYTGGGASGASDDPIQRMGIAESTARELGIDPSRVEYGGDGYPFSVGDDNFVAAGQFDPSSGKITLYNGALHATDTQLKGMMSHEVQHAKFHDVLKAHNQEYQSLIDDPVEKFDHQGKLFPQYEKDYPVYSAMNPYFSGDRYKELVNKDGITAYSTSYWKAWKQGKVTTESAINETLAEVAHQKALGVKTGIPNVWRNFYNDLNDQYKRLKK